MYSLPITARNIRLDAKFTAMVIVCPTNDAPKFAAAALVRVIFI